MTSCQAHRATQCKSTKVTRLIIFCEFPNIVDLPQNISPWWTNKIADEHNLLLAPIHIIKSSLIVKISIGYWCYLRAHVWPVMLYIEANQHPLFQLLVLRKITVWNIEIQKGSPKVKSTCISRVIICYSM